jgi:fatty-acyl-CoA synthase
MLDAGMTMDQALRQVAEARRGQEALICGEARVTYGQLLERVGALAAGLRALGVGKGDRVVALLPPGPEFVTLFFAVADLGAVIVPLNPQARQHTLEEVLADAAPVVLVTARALEEAAGKGRHVLLAGEASGSGIRLVELMGSGSLMEVSGRQHPCGYLRGCPPYEGAEEVAAKGRSYERWDQEEVGEGRAERHSAPLVRAEDLLALLYTSGTTGKPKGTMHSHRSLIAPVAASTKLRELWLRRPNLKTIGQMAVALGRYRQRLLRAVGKPQTFLSTTGWHTITGLEVMLQALLMGDRLVILPRFHPRQALELVERERVTILVAVPMAFKVMAGMQATEQYDTSSLLICGTGAAPCPPELAHEIQDRFGCAVHIGFGATETGGGISATSIADSAARQAETVGQPMPGMEVKIVDEGHRELPRGAVGELACRSDSVMVGYYGAPEATAEVLDEEGWYYTGDLARMDEAGYIHIVGRKRDVIIRGGQNVYPAEIEAYLTAHDKIREAAVVGVAAAVGGEEAWAYLLLEDGAEMTAREVAGYCRAALEPFKMPSQVRFVADYPRSETGKPQKFKLREQASQEQASRE